MLIVPVAVSLAKKNYQEHNQQNQAQATGIISPGGTVRPCWQRSDYQQKQYQ